MDKPVKQLIVIALIITAGIGVAVFYGTLGDADQQRGTIEIDGTPPHNMEAYTIDVEGQTYLCIEHARTAGGGERERYGLSCTPINETRGSP